MKTLTLLRHFEYDEQKNVPQDVFDDKMPLLAQLFSIRATPYPAEPKQLHDMIGMHGIEIEGFRPGRYCEAKVSPAHGLGTIDFVTSSDVPRAIQTADALVAYFSGATRLPNQVWAGENYTGDIYKGFHTEKYKRGDFRVNHHDDFVEYADFLKNLPSEAQHVVLVTHLPTIRALAICSATAGDLGELNAMEHRLRDEGDGNPERFGLSISIQADNWSDFAVGHGNVRDRINGTGSYIELALSFHIANRLQNFAPDLQDYIMAIFNPSYETKRELALREFNPL